MLLACKQNYLSISVPGPVEIAFVTNDIKVCRILSSLLKKLSMVFSTTQFERRLSKNRDFDRLLEVTLNLPFKQGFPKWGRIHYLKTATGIGGNSRGGIAVSNRG